MAMLKVENLTKTFKKIKGVSPKQYRDTKKETTKKFLLSQ